MEPTKEPKPTTLLTVDFKSRKLVKRDVLDNRYTWQCTCCLKSFTYIPGKSNIQYIGWEAPLKNGNVEVNICEECIKQLNMMMEEE